MEMFDSVVFGKNIRELREKNGLSGKQLAKNTGISAGNLVRIEHGEIVARMDTAFKLASYFGVSIDYLCNRSIQPIDEIDSMVSISSDSRLSHDELDFVKKVTEFMIDQLNKSINK